MENNILPQNIDDFFSQDYYQSREKFLKECEICGFEVKSQKLPDFKGPNNRDIFMDCASFGNKNAKNLLVIISGTHGPEGYCGAGVQLGLLKTGLAQQFAENCKIALIHAHNAFGFAWDTRFNENNIDLNRNYLDDWLNLPQNADYDTLAQWALPAQFDDESANIATIKMLEYAREHGFERLQAALTKGQYNHPKGVYYGGDAPSWSQITLLKFLDELCQTARNLIIIDMHTGLGAFGHGEILCDCAPNTLPYERLQQIWGNEVVSTKSDNSVSADLTGSLDSAFMKRYNDKNPAVIAIEFGTIDPLSVFKATQATSWLHSYGNPESPLGDKYRQLSRDAFYPQSQEWRQKVWHRSLELIQKAIASFDK
jgi:Protein of unknown function (DUF2817)